MKRALFFLSTAFVVTFYANAQSLESNDWFSNGEYLKPVKMILQDSVINYNNGVPESKYVYAYDTNKNKTFDATYKWDAEANSWVMTSATKYERAYDVYRNQVLCDSYNWDAETNTWVNTNKTKTEHTYDTSNKVTLSITYNWDIETNLWIKMLKSEFAYDTEGRQTLIADYYWNPTSALWVGNNKYEYAYDDNGHLAQDGQSVGVNAEAFADRGDAQEREHGVDLEPVRAELEQRA